MTDLLNRPKKSRGWCYTTNNYSDADVEKLRALSTDSAVTYSIFGYEIAPSTKTPHLQGFIFFTNCRAFNTVKELLPTGSHIEPKSSKSTPLQAAEYCKKSESSDTSKPSPFEEFGELPIQGKRNDISDAIATLRRTKSLSACAEDHEEAFVRYHRGLGAWATAVGIVPARSTPPRVSVVVGLPGTGKSRLASEAPDGDCFIKPHGDWWDGYHQQRRVVLDDFRGGYPFSALLTLLDRYPLRVPVKGGFEVFNSGEIWITSNDYVCDWYKPEVTHGRLDALFRRITNYFELHPDGTATAPWAEAHQHLGRGDGGPDALRGLASPINNGVCYAEPVDVTYQVVI